MTRKTAVAAAVPAPIVRVESAAQSVRAGVGFAKDCVKAGGILGFAFIRTLVTGKVSEPVTPSRKRARK